MTELDRQIADALQSLKSDQGVASEPPAHYMLAFASSARDKAAEVLESFKKAGKFRSDRPVFVSVGGGNGEEIIFLLKHSNGTRGVLIELVARFADEAKRRELPPGKELVVLAMPAQQGIRDAMRIAEEACCKGRPNSAAGAGRKVRHLRLR